MSKADMKKLGLGPTGNQIIALAKVYCQPARSPRKQAEAIEAARANGHTVATLHYIETQVKKLGAKKLAWAFRLKMCRTPEKDVKKAARAYLAEQRTPEPPRKSVRTLLRPDRGEASFTITGPMEEITPLACDSYEEFFRPMAQRSVRPIVGLWVDDAVKIIHGENGEKKFILTDGTIMTGRQLTQHLLAEEGLAILVHETEGAVDLYRTERVANDKQRLMLAFTQPVCEGENCTMPADKCQPHHVKAWSQGGHTNFRNLANLCRFHNGWNDDDRTNPRHGHLIYLGQTPYWRFPSGTIIRNQHFRAALGPMRQPRPSKPPP